MGTLLYDLSVIHNQNLVCLFDRCQTMGNGNDDITSTDYPDQNRQFQSVQTKNIMKQKRPHSTISHTVRSGITPFGHNV